MGINRMKKRVAGQTVDATPSGSGIVNISVAVATDDVVTGIAWMRRVINSKLRVVENIECLGSELQIPLAENPELLQQRKIEIGAAGIMHGIPPAVSESQPAWRNKGRWIVDQRPKCLREVFSKFDMGIGTADAIGIRPGSEIVGDATIVRYSDASRTAAINYAKWSAGLEMMIPENCQPSSNTREAEESQESPLLWGDTSFVGSSSNKCVQP
jgi:hypothetical protein